MAGGQLRWWLAICAAGLSCLFWVGCGGETTETQTRKDAADQKLLPGQISLDETVYECLVEVGAQFAVARRDLAFFRDAEAADDIAQIGEKTDHRDDGVIVRLLASRSGGASEWMLWYSQPPGSSLDPEAIVESPTGISDLDFSPAKDPYVAFKVKPKYAFRKEIHRCVEFPLAAG